MTAFDVAVVGAGPAGAIAARELACAGARVALLDGSHPREKPCGGGVTGRALAVAGQLPHLSTPHQDTTSPVQGGASRFQGGATPLQGGSSRVPGEVSPAEGVRSQAEGAQERVVAAAVFEHATRRAVVPLPDADVLHVFAREQFDLALREQALARGAIGVEARLTKLARTAAGWEIRTSTGATLQAAHLLAADGAASGLRRQLFRPFARHQLSIAAGSYVDGVETSEIVIAFIDRPRGYLWSFPRPGHLAVGTCAQADDTSAAEMHACTDAWLERYAPAAGRPRRRYAWPIPSLDAQGLDAERPAGDGWMLLGDAAGLVDPITREGIYFAMRSGQLAAEALRTAAPAAAYAEAVRDELHAELRRAARLKEGFFRPRFTGLLVGALGDSAAVRSVMVDLIGGRQPYAGLKRRLIRTMEFGLMWKMLRQRVR